MTRIIVLNEDNQEYPKQKLVVVKVWDGEVSHPDKAVEVKAERKELARSQVFDNYVHSNRFVTVEEKT